MSSYGAECARRLEAMGHSDLLDSPDDRSTRPSDGAAWARRVYDLPLGARRLGVFRALHRKELEALEASFPARGLDAEDSLWRGRVRRLLGRTVEAQRDWSRAGAAAASWRAETLLLEDPDAALRLLSGRAREDLWGLVWEALASGRKGKPGLALLEEVLPRFGRPLLVPMLALAAALHEEERHEDAAALLERAARAFPADPAPLTLLSRVESVRGRADAARRAFDRARDLDLDAAGSYFEDSSGAKLSWDDPRGYLSALDAAISRDPRSAALHAERAELKRDPRLCLYREALEDYARAASLAPRVGWIRASLARAVNKAGGAQAGLSDFDAACRLAPRSGWIRAWRGAALSRAGRPERALEDFAAAETAMPWYPFTYAWRGAVLVRQGRWADALRDLDRAVELDPRYLFSRYERFRARRGAGDHEGALSDLDVCFRADPKYDWLGGDGEKALPSLRKAVRALPRSAWARAWLGYSLLRLGRVAQASTALSAAARLAPREPLLRAWLGEALSLRGRDAQARREYSRALRGDPRLWIAHRGLAALARRSGDLRQALSRLREVVRLTPTTVASHIDAAEVAAALGLRDEALADLSRALELDPAHLEASLRCAEIALRAGLLDEAARRLEPVFAADSPPARAYAARGLLSQARGDAASAERDLRRAYELDPSVFPESVREAAGKLLSGGGSP